MHVYDAIFHWSLAKTFVKAFRQVVALHLRLDFKRKQNCRSCKHDISFNKTGAFLLKKLKYFTTNAYK